MYITTFYSFKGGVGRSMALMNVAMEMIKEGLNVLVVDFDLEAPGIDTFKTLKPTKPCPGILEYVEYFKKNRKADEINKYIYSPSSLDENFGNLWVMPAGIITSDYAKRLNKIGWQDLYENKDGFLIMEDLRNQWQIALNPDYVLIDSRTGHSDILGICTRQLPDAVVCLFFPNEQNLYGLCDVVEKIRNQNQKGEFQVINLHFVNSNVPDLDDENEILKNRMEEFQKKLHFNSITSTIHHYPSLALLNQTLFSLERPKSRLAAEYRELLRKIRFYNSQDKVGVVDYLNQYQNKILGHQTNTDFEDQETAERRLKAILGENNRDPEILFLISQIKEKQGNLEDAINLLKSATNIDATQSEFFVKMADLELRMDHSSDAIKSIFSVLNLEKARDYDVRICVRWLRLLDKKALSKIPETPALRTLGPMQTVRLCAEILSSDKKTLQIGETLLKEKLSLETSPDFVNALTNSLVLNLIGQGKASQAIDILNGERPIIEDMNIVQLFNFAMADWSLNRRPQKDLFKKVVDLDPEPTPDTDDPNYAQCIALANWVIGNKKIAEAYLDQSMNLIKTRSTSTFSCWSYLYVGPKTFFEHLNEIKRLFNGENIKPIFIN